MPTAFDPRQSPGLSGTKGEIYTYSPAVGDAILLQKQDNGLSTNWVQIGAAVNVGNIDGGTPSSNYGGTAPIDGGTP